MRAEEFRFTVVIPTYNRWHLLPRALRSVREQKWPDVEVLVVDDCSTQPIPCTLPILFPEVRFFRQPANLGPGVARNRGLAEAERPWVVMLDDDDWLLPGAFRRIAQSIAERPFEDAHPVFQFSHEHGELDSDFRLVKLADYVQGRLNGDFLPVFHRETSRRMS